MGPIHRRAAVAAVLMVALGGGQVMAAAKAPAAKSPVQKPAPATPAAMPDSMSLGSPKAPVQVVEYASLTCPHCARFNAEVFPAFKAKYVDTGKVHYTLKEFLTPPAELAAAGWVLARCGGPAHYFGIVDGIFRSQTRWVQGADIAAILLDVAKANGLTEDQFKACLNDDAAYQAVSARAVKAQADGVNATPTFFVNGKKVSEGVMSLADLDAAIAAAGK
jgi:protein-disulfide isomerase